MATDCALDADRAARRRQAAQALELQSQGWQKQFTYDEPRLSEAVELYRQMGLEVRIEPMLPEGLDQVCTACMEGQCQTYQTIYTRQPAKGN